MRCALAEGASSSRRESVYLCRVPEVGETFLKWRIDARLEHSEGRLVEAFRATDVDAGYEVRLEILRAGATSVEKARFGTRARRLLSIAHPALLSAIDASGTHCAFESPVGEPLSEHAGIAIARARQKLSWLAQIAGALAELHRGGVVHGHLGLDDVIALPDTSVKLAVPLTADASASPLDDVRAFGAAACELVLGADAAEGEQEAKLAERLVAAGLPSDPAATIARVRAGPAMSSTDLAEKLAPHGDYAGPTTEPLLPVVPPR